MFLMSIDTVEVLISSTSRYSLSYKLSPKCILVLVPSTALVLLTLFVYQFAKISLSSLHHYLHLNANAFCSCLRSNLLVLVYLFSIYLYIKFYEIFSFIQRQQPSGTTIYSRVQFHESNPYEHVPITLLSKLWTFVKVQ